jgi:hypothetical protein
MRVIGITSLHPTTVTLITYEAAELPVKSKV